MLLNQFVSYDDQLYVTGNFHVQRGLTLAGAKWAFTTTAGANWHPLTWLSHMLDYQLYRLAPWGHHFTNLLLHLANTLLVFAVLRRFTGALWRSWFVAALFAIHPMHVESVAWVAERKDVLSTCFALLTLWAYAQHAGGTQSRWFHFMALFFFAGGLLCKPMLVTLPFVLLLLDYWPLNRLTGKNRQSTIREKAPFFALAALSCVITYLAQQSGNAITATADLPIANRLENVLVAYGWYLLKFLFPVDLAVIYPYETHWPAGTVILCGAVLAAITLAAVLVRHRHPWLLVGWLWFGGTLVPVIGLVQVGSQGMADRYSYLPYLGLFIILSWAGAAWKERSRWPKSAAALAMATPLLICSILTWRQIGYWKNSQSLFQHAVAVTQNNFIALANLADNELSLGHVQAAIDLDRQAIGFKSSFAPAYGQLGMALCKAGQPGEGIAKLKQALQMDPKLSQTHADLADILAQTGADDAAIPEYQEAVRLDPDNLEALNHLGVALENAGRTDEAVVTLEKAISCYPAYVDAHNNLGLAFEQQRKLAEAASEYGEAVRLAPKFAKGHFNLGMILNQEGRLDDAIAELRQGLLLDSTVPQAHNELGLLLAGRGRAREAMVEFQTALQLKPDFSEASNNLALLRQIRGNSPN